MRQQAMAIKTLGGSGGLVSALFCCCVAALVWLFPAQICAETPDEPAAPTELKGTVVDEKGQPLEGAQVTAEPLDPEATPEATPVEGWTGKDGTFNLQLAAPRHHYRVTVWRCGYAYLKSARVPAETAGAFTVTLGGGDRLHALSGEVRNGQTGQPMPGVKVRLVGYLQTERVSGEQGGFRFDGIPERPVDTAILAEANGLAACQGVPGTDDEAVLPMVPVARLKGIVKEREAGTPVADCTVSARFVGWWRRSFRQTKTDKDGRFEFTSMPRGGYEIVVSDDLLFDSAPDSRVAPPEISLAANTSPFLEVTVRRKATVTGSVIGPDGQPARHVEVGLESKRHGRSVSGRTDAEGKFLLSMSVSDESVSVNASSRLLGSAQQAVGTLKEGEVRKDIVVRLPGTQRIWGKVTDPEGRPIPGVRVGSWWALGASAETGLDGTFDLRAVLRKATARKYLTLEFIAPRPFKHESAEAPDPGARFFHHKEITVLSPKEKELNLEAVLEPTALLTFTGKVFEHDGQPSAKTSVVLFTSDAEQSVLNAELYPSRFARPASTQGIILGRTKTDEHGVWTIRAARETGKDLRLEHRWSVADPARYSVGAGDRLGATALLQNITLAQAEVQKVVDLKLGAPPAESLVTVEVVDKEGKPVPGITVSSSRFCGGLGTDPGGPITTDPNGRFTVWAAPDGFVSIHWRAKGWTVLSHTNRTKDDSLVLKEPGGNDKTVRIVCGRNGELTGAVRWDTGDPAMHYRVGVQGCLQEVCNEKGSYRLKNSPVGTQHLTVGTADGIYETRESELQPGEARQVDFVLPFPKYTVRGQVVDKDGNPVRNVSVFSARELPRLYVRVRVDEQGRFELRLPRGTHCLSTESHDEDKVLRQSQCTIVAEGDNLDIQTRIVVSLVRPKRPQP
jgi:protocatechuate 3,4-dioxygenase beta subunit